MAGVSINVKDFRTEIPGTLSADGLTWEFPTIESANSRGKMTTWRIYVRVIPPANAVTREEFLPIADEWFDSTTVVPGRGWYKVDSGLVGGKIKDSSPTIVSSGKNIGKASATNVWTQALRDAYGQHNKQAKKSTAAVSKSTTELYPPMLAQIYRSSPSTTPTPGPYLPLYMQRKYNGVRMCATLERTDAPADAPVTDRYRVVMYSRKRNLYPGFGYLRKELLPALAAHWDAGRQLYLDGEIYKHGVALQDISGAARRGDESNDPATQYNYMIYDCFIPAEPDLSFTDRQEELDAVFAIVNAQPNPSHLVRVDTEAVTDVAGIDAYYQRALADGYEGAMIRTDDVYAYSYNDRHVRQLLKIKPSFDAEFPIVAWSADGAGKAAGALMIVCEHKGKRFPVTPAMELPERVALARKMATVEENQRTHFDNHWLGKSLIVTFDERSKDDLPLRARTRMELRTWD